MRRKNSRGKGRKRKGSEEKEKGGEEGVK